MDKELYLYTIYAPDGRRVGLGVKESLEQVSLLGKRDSGLLGPNYTYKTWECKEVEPVKTGESAH